MKRYHRLAAVMSGLMLFSLTGCEYFDSSESEAQISDHSAQRYNIQAVEDTIKSLSDTWTYQNKEEEVQQQIDWLLNAVDEAYAVDARAQIDYYADWNSEDLHALEKETYEDYCVVSDLTSWAFAHGYKKSMYRKLFEPYVDPDDLEYYLVNSMQRIKSYARLDAEDSSSLLNDYYDSAFNQDTGTDETNEECAKLYLKTLKQYDLSEYMYDQYHRDYTAEQVSEIYQKILAEIVPLQKKLEDKLDGMQEQYGNTYKQDAFDLVREYAPKISPEVGKSADALFSQSLYRKAKGDACYDGSYTVSFPNEPSAFIYIYADDTYYDLLTLTHEFGHFHADRNDTTPIFMQKPNLDIAESQSQSMAMLFTEYYPDMLGDSAEFYELVDLYNLLDSLISGFAVGEFEYEVMQKIDKITAKEVEALFKQINTDTGMDRELYQITHLYEQPGYYVSYGVSALPALELYIRSKDDFDAAVSDYEKLCEISCMSGETTFSEAMQECGLGNFFAPDAGDEMIDYFKTQLLTLIP